MDQEQINKTLRPFALVIFEWVGAVSTDVQPFLVQKTFAFLEKIVPRAPDERPFLVLVVPLPNGQANKPLTHAIETAALRAGFDSVVVTPVWPSKDLVRNLLNHFELGEQEPTLLVGDGGSAAYLGCSHQPIQGLVEVADPLAEGTPSAISCPRCSADTRLVMWGKAGNKSLGCPTCSHKQPLPVDLALCDAGAKSLFD